jgi:MFS family permease
MKFTMPTITKSMGFTSANAQLLTIPPYVIGAISSIVFAKLSDRHYWRMPFIVIPFLFLVVGFSVILPFAPKIKDNIAACYVAVCLVCVGLYPINPAGSAWISSNLAGPSKRGMGIALNICLGNLGGIVGSYMFLDKEAPGYHTGFGIGLAVSAAGVLNTLGLELSYHLANKKKARLTEDEWREKYTEDQLAKMGDKSPLFKYNL